MTMNGNGNRAAGIYVRISQDSEGKGLGVARQEEDCRKLCEQRGWHVVRVYSDNDVSAYSGKPRPDYKEMMGDVAVGTVNAIVAYNADRLHRSPIELEAFITAVETAHADVATVTSGDIDLGTADGRLQARLLGMVARHQSERAAERIRRKLEQNRADGKPHGGLRKYGYEKQEGNGLVVVQHEADVIRECARRILAGQGLNSVTKWLNDIGEPTSTGKRWHSNVLRTCLTNPILIGQGKEAKGRWDAILDRQTQLTLTAILKKRGTSPNQAPWQLGEYLLSGGILRCGKCGASMIHTKLSRKPNGERRSADTYSCRAKKFGGCNGVSIKASDADSYVSAQVFEHLSKIAVPVPAENAPQAPDTRELDRLTAERKGVFANAANEGWSREDVREMLSVYDEKIEAEQQRINAYIVDDASTRVAEEVRWRLSQMTEADFYEGDNLEQQREAIRLVTERVEVLPATRRGGRSTMPAADRIRIEWKAL